MLADERGCFAIQLSSASVHDVRLIASHDRGRLLGLWETSDAAPLALLAKIDATIVLKPSEELVANVVDSGGNPVVKASVSAIHGYTPVAFGETDERGTVLLRVPRDARVGHILGMKPGVGMDYFENQVSN